MSVSVLVCAPRHPRQPCRSAEEHTAMLHSAAREASSLSWRVGLTLWAAGENPRPSKMISSTCSSSSHRLATRKGSTSLHMSPSCHKPPSCKRSHPWHSSSHQPIPCQDLFVTTAWTVEIAVVPVRVITLLIEPFCPRSLPSICVLLQQCEAL